MVAALGSVASQVLMVCGVSAAGSVPVAAVICLMTRIRSVMVRADRPCPCMDASHASTRRVGASVSLTILKDVATS